MIQMNKCCGSCCFPQANASKEVLDAAGQNWYNQANINRLWREIQTTGRFLMCHQTDPNASTYGGKDSKKGVEDTHACVGCAFLVYMHIKIFEYYKSYKKYVKAVGEYIALDERALQEAAWSFVLGRGNLFGGMTLPKEMNEDPDTLRYPTGFEKVIAVFKAITQVTQTEKVATK